MEGLVGRMFVFVSVFLGCFVVLVSLIPPELGTNPNWANPQLEAIPDFWNKEDMMSFADTKVYILNATFITKDFVVGGRNLRLTLDHASNLIIMLQRYGPSLLWVECMEWSDQNNQRVGFPVGMVEAVNTVVIDTANQKFGKMRFKVTSLGQAAGSSAFSVTSLFAYNTTLYSGSRNAWDNNELHMVIGIGADDANTALNAWDLVGQLMTFQTPLVFGDSGPVSFALNAIIALPLWAMIAFIVVAIVLEIIPF